MRDPSLYEREQKAKEYAAQLAPKNRAAQAPPEQEYAKAYATDSGAVGPAFDRPARPSLQERVAKQLCHAAGEARNLEQLEELRYLLDRNPDVARILDLMEIVRG